MSEDVRVKLPDGTWESLRGPRGFTGFSGGSGSDGPPGPVGPPGTGTIWYNGTGAPSNSLGADNDYYLDNSNGNVWFKTGGVWT